MLTFGIDVLVMGVLAITNLFIVTLVCYLRQPEERIAIAVINAVFAASAVMFVGYVAMCCVLNTIA